VPFDRLSVDRARGLLLEYLSPAQRETFLASGHFDVDRSGARRSVLMRLLRYPRFRVYRISAQRLPVVLFTSPRRLARSRPKYVYCIHSRTVAPKYDELLSLKLLLEHDEPRFVRIAFRVRLFGNDWPVPFGLDALR
jgi:hypothetical protein